MAARLTIYIDGRCLLRPRNGVGAYAARLLAAVLQADTRNTYIALGFADQRSATPLLAEKQNFHYHFLPLPRRLYMGIFRLFPLAVDAFLPYKADAVWYPDFVTAPWITHGKKILTIHDLTYLHEPEVVEAKNLRYLRRFVPWSVQRAAIITTVSETVKRDITKQLAPQQPIDVLYPIAPPEAPGMPDTKQPYILFVGTLEPRKNIPTLIEAYQALPAQLRKTYRLVVAGGRGWQDDAILAQLQSSGANFVQNPTDSHIAQLYAGASLFVIPSLREGFGMTTVEALAYHVPVITSDDPALVEATGKSALHVPAMDSERLAAAMTQLLTDADARQKLAAARSKQLQAFAAEPIAKRFLRLLED